MLGKTLLTKTMYDVAFISLYVSVNLSDYNGLHRQVVTTLNFDVATLD